jgi:cytidylate kinase
MSDLLIVTGPPGSGKSTVARLLAERFERCALVQGDLFFGFVVRGYIDPWLPASHEQNVVVTEAAATASGRFPKGGSRKAGGYGAPDST